MSKCGQQDNTVESVTASRGTPRRLIKPTFDVIETVPASQQVAKKLNGIIPHRTKRGNFSTREGKIWVKIKVRTPIMTNGFNKDQNTPRDMFRYRILKSFRINCL